MTLVPRELLQQSLLQLWEIKSIQIKVGDQEDAWFRHSNVCEIRQAVVSNTLKDLFLPEGSVSFEVWSTHASTMYDLHLELVISNRNDRTGQGHLKVIYLDYYDVPSRCCPHAMRDMTREKNHCSS